MAKETKYKVPFEIGHQITGTITKVKGECHWGHKVGDELEINIHNPGGMCGVFYNAIYPYIAMLQMGVNFPKEWGPAHWDGDTLVFDCTDVKNAVRIKLRRFGPNRPPRVIH